MSEITPGMHAIPNLNPRMLVLITDTLRAKKAEEILKHAHTPAQFRLHGTGTANSDLMVYLGMDGAEKTLFTSVAPRTVIRSLIQTLSKSLKLERPGHGILFTLPIGGIGLPMMRLMNEHITKHVEKIAESEIETMMEKSSYSMILAITNRGYSEDVMETAKRVGARGGTVLHARRLGMEEAMHFWGISIQDEREVVAILAKKENKANIMRAIGENHGLRSEAKGLVLSIPVEDIYGLT